MYLVSYDITSDKIRNKVAKKLLNYGKRVQFSVFECDITFKEYRKMYAELMDIVSDRDDVSIRLYPLDADVYKRLEIIGIPDLKEERLDDFWFIG